MGIYYTEIIKSIIVITVYLLSRIASNQLISKNLTGRFLQKSRGEVIRKVINLILLSICIVLISVIWGVSHSDLAVFAGSVLTVIGVAMFAQWSILSNITSSIIIFFNHSVRLDDTISIMEGKDYEIRGKVTEIGLFFVTLETEEGEEITLPNNVFIQKTIKKKVYAEK
ncbi:MAG: small-conductance mechanosensitive channel [Bacteroidia bacterium]|jgi:small-conductance mechanosensitive channel